MILLVLSNNWPSTKNNSMTFGMRTKNQLRTAPSFTTNRKNGKTSLLFWEKSLKSGRPIILLKSFHWTIRMPLKTICFILKLTSSKLKMLKLMLPSKVPKTKNFNSKRLKNNIKKKSSP
jgi:hypothetical protein